MEAGEIWDGWGVGFRDDVGMLRNNNDICIYIYIHISVYSVISKKGPPYGHRKWYP